MQKKKIIKYKKIKNKNNEKKPTKHTTNKQKRKKAFIFCQDTADRQIQKIPPASLTNQSARFLGITGQEKNKVINLLL